MTDSRPAWNSPTRPFHVGRPCASTPTVSPSQCDSSPISRAASPAALARRWNFRKLAISILRWSITTTACLLAAAEPAAPDLRQVAHQALVLVGAHGVLDLVVARGVGAQRGDHAGAGVGEPVLDLLDQRQHVFEPAVLLVVEIGVEPLAHALADLGEQHLALPRDAVLGDVGGRVLVADRVVLELPDGLAHLRPHSSRPKPALMRFDAVVDLLLHAGEQAALACP